MKTTEDGEKYVADTHAILWHLSSDSRLSTEARRRFLMADHGEAIIYISAITPIEIIYLVEKNKIPERSLNQFRERVGSEPEESYQLVNLSYDLAFSIAKVPRTVVPELSDRIIAATSYYLNLPLITKDSRIQQWDGIVTVW